MPDPSLLDETHVPAAGRSGRSAVDRLRAALASTPGPKVVAVVLTFNSASYVVRGVSALLESSLPVTVLVVDNGSSDGSSDLVESALPAAVVHRTGANLGYAGGNNVGVRMAREAGADVVVLVNPDATVDTRCVEELVAAMSARSSAAAATPIITLEGTDTVWYAGAGVDLRTGATYHHEVGASYQTLATSPPHATGRANGCVMAIRLDLPDQLQLLDEAYFLYYEETEWSVRVQRSGYEILVVPAARAWHATGHGLFSCTPTYHYYMVRNRLSFLSEYGTWPTVAAARATATDALLNLWLVARTRPQALPACASAAVQGVTDFLRGRRGPRRPQRPRYRRPVPSANLAERAARRVGHPRMGPIANAVLRVLGLEIPATVRIGGRLHLPHGGVGIVLHGSTVLGDDVTIFQGVTIGRADQYLRADQLAPGGGVEVRDRALVGAGAAVLFRSGQTVTIGEDAVIGANAVVLDSVPAGEIWAGAPARRVGLNPNHRPTAPPSEG